MPTTNKLWRYKLSKPERTVNRALRGVYFTNCWLTIRNGEVAVHPGYAWDGCSPSIPVFGTGLWLGPWDGPLQANGRPVAWRASLFHDALCQFRRDIPNLSKNAATRVFAGELALSGAPWWMLRLYPLAVDLLGPQDFMRV